MPDPFAHITPAMPYDMFGTFSCRLSKGLIDRLREHTGEQEKADGWNEFVEAACRRSLLEGWDARHATADIKNSRRWRLGNAPTD